MMTLTQHPDKKGFYLLEAECEISRPVDEVFELFSDAFKLESITPPWLNFHVITPAPIEMQVGTLIDYQLRMYGIPMRWQSEITVWEPGMRFVDEQVRGPYKCWHHEHGFKQVGDKTIVSDKVEYGVPGGSLVHNLFVRKNVETIFKYRTEKLLELFSSEENSSEK